MGGEHQHGRRDVGEPEGSGDRGGGQSAKVIEVVEVVEVIEATTSPRSPRHPRRPRSPPLYRGEDFADAERAHVTQPPREHERDVLPSYDEYRRNILAHPPDTRRCISRRADHLW